MKENKIKKAKNPKNKAKKEKIQKEKKPNKFIEIIKKKWLINGTKTFILIAVIIALFIGINIAMQKLELTPIDFSQDKLYTLTDESKEKVKNIDKDVNIYFVGYTDDDTTLDLAKQYKNLKTEIELAGKNYYVDTESTTFFVKTLIDEGYLKANSNMDIIDP